MPLGQPDPPAAPRDAPDEINAVAGERMPSTTHGEFTGKTFAVGNRMLHKGMTIEAPSDNALS